MQQQSPCSVEIHQAQTQELKQAISNRLSALGWSRSDGPAVASKNVRTAVGNRSAFAYLHVFRDPKSQCDHLAGDYESEGRNVLESHFKRIPKGCTIDALNACVDDFSRNVDRVVAGTYAVRLLPQAKEIAEALPLTVDRESEGRLSSALQFAEAAKAAVDLAQVCALAHSYSGILSEDAYDDHDAYYFQNDGSAARINRLTLEVEVLGETKGL